jgi:hypothetical protein
MAWRATITHCACAISDTRGAAKPQAAMVPIRLRD